MKLSTQTQKAKHRVDNLEQNVLVIVFSLLSTRIALWLDLVDRKLAPWELIYHMKRHRRTELRNEKRSKNIIKKLNYQ